MTKSVLFSLLVSFAAAENSLEYPDVFTLSGNHLQPCDTNGIVTAWCDSHVHTDLACGIAPDFDEYGCTCHGNSALCPTECVDGATTPLMKNGHSIRCQGIPKDNHPNYILKEHHVMKGCENNALVAGWCDDYINKHLACGLYPEEDQYLCKCRYVRGFVGWMLCALLLAIF